MGAPAIPCRIYWVILNIQGKEEQPAKTVFRHYSTNYRFCAVLCYFVRSCTSQPRGKSLETSFHKWGSWNRAKRGAYLAEPSGGTTLPPSPRALDRSVLSLN